MVCDDDEIIRSRNVSKSSQMTIADAEQVEGESLHLRDDAADSAGAAWVAAGGSETR